MTIRASLLVEWSSLWRAAFMFKGEHKATGVALERSRSILGETTRMRLVKFHWSG